MFASKSEHNDCKLINVGEDRSIWIPLQDMGSSSDSGQGLGTQESTSSSGCSVGESDSLDHFGPNKQLDMGYHTLVHNEVINRSLKPQLRPENEANYKKSVSSKLLDVRATTTAISELHILTHNARRRPLLTTNKASIKGAADPLSSLSDSLIKHILGFLPDSASLARCSRVNRRLYSLCWSSSLWRQVMIEGDLDADLALKSIFRLVIKSSDLETASIAIHDCPNLTDRGLAIVARKCAARLRRLEMQRCASVTNAGVQDLVHRCRQLVHLDVSGCPVITTVSLPPAFSISAALNLQHLDLSDCTNLGDQGLKAIVENAPKLTNLYLRRCQNITDVGVRHVSLYCLWLKELSLSSCPLISDQSLSELARLGPTLRYVSLSKCALITDKGLSKLAKLCYKLRYVNVRGCVCIGDQGLLALSASCTRLRSLDLGQCDVTDEGLQFLSQNCPNLKRLGLKNCEMISDKGVESVAFYCRGLTHLNVQECTDISVGALNAVKKWCRVCVIEHSNPGLL